MIAAPGFWWNTKPSLRAVALSPAALAWGAIAARRIAGKGWDCGVPVICVGNFVAGGAGKTPVAIAVAEIARRLGMAPFLLSRGHGGKSGATPVLVDPARHSARDVGDEPLLLARTAPVIVSADRRAGARAATEAGATVIIMDDGLQNPSLRKTLAIAVIDAEVGIGNAMCIPSGPLRAPMAAQWPLVDALVTRGEGDPGRALSRWATGLGKPAFAAQLTPDNAIAAAMRGKKVMAFAGIGRPEKFFATLKDVGADLAGWRSFADHHNFTEAELTALTREASALDATLVTTEKDAARLPPGFAAHAFPVRAAFADPSGFEALLAQALRG